MPNSETGPVYEFLRKTEINIVNNVFSFIDVFTFTTLYKDSYNHC